MTSGDSPSEPRVAKVVPLVPAWRLDRAFDYLLPERLARRVGPGSLVRVPLGHRRVRGVIVAWGDEPGRPGLEEIASVVLEPAVAPGPLAALAVWMAERYAVPRGLALARLVPPRVRVDAPPPTPLRGGPEPRRVLSYEGGRDLIAAIESRGSGAWCLRARPSEDRGELIAELVAAAGRAGAGAALVAVPEIRYGSLVLDGLGRHFETIARIDSARPDAERARSLVRLARGHGLGGGGRGAVLAPCPELRLIVVDEEHHLSYKEDRAPRYDARRVALQRARLQDAVCVLVSSTPSLETGFAAAAGDVGTVEPGRAQDRAERPLIELVDRPGDRALSHDLHRRVTDALRAGRRVALLAPSRGFARALWCGACRRSLRCPVCEAGLFFDRAASRVRCPRCDHREPAPIACPSCGASEFRHMGAGSERLAEQLAKAFPRAPVRRVDPEVLDAPGTPSTGVGEPGIYVTTWIGTKEALRPQASLVGVLDADALIRRPEFRSAEYAYQALAEMARWAGPAASGGRLVIQSAEPGHHAIQAVVRGDYRFFLTRELEQRRELSYPPFSELVRIEASGSAAEAWAQRCAEEARRGGGRVLGPIPVAGPRRPGPRRAGPRRAGREAGGAGGPGLELLVKAPDASQVAQRLRVILAELPAGTRLRVDVDPR